MAIKQSQYEELLATYTDHQGMLLLLKRFRPYLEMLPSMRRPSESLITIPLPIIQVREAAPSGVSSTPNLAPGDAVRVPCDVAVLMCDPDWKIKTGVEIFVFIHRPNEDFSDLLGRWRQTQLWLNRGYDWVMPPRYRHIFSEGAEDAYALFVIFPETPDRIRRGLNGAALPYVIEKVRNTGLECGGSLETGETLTENNDDTVGGVTGDVTAGDEVIPNDINLNMKVEGKENDENTPGSQSSTRSPADER